MLVDCPDCGRSYRLDADALGPRGRVVICPRCNARWFQRGAGGENAAAAAWTTVRTAEGFAGRSASQRSELPQRHATAAGPCIDAHALSAGRPAFSRSWLRGLRGGAAALLIACVATAGVGARAAVVRAVPRTASIYAAIGWPVNLRGLRFARVRASGVAGQPGVAGGAAANDVVLAGELRSVAPGRVAVPRLVFEVRDAGGAVLVRWSETPPATTLAAGQALAFASRPQRMPPDGRTVLVRFEDAAPNEPGPSRALMVRR